MQPLFGSDGAYWLNNTLVYPAISVTQYTSAHCLLITGIIALIMLCYSFTVSPKPITERKPRWKRKTAP